MIEVSLYEATPNEFQRLSEHLLICDPEGNLKPHPLLVGFATLTVEHFCAPEIQLRGVTVW